MPKHLSHFKIRRAKVIVDDEGKKVLTTCESCGTDVYLLEGQTFCSVHLKAQVSAAMAET